MRREPGAAGAGFLLILLGWSTELPKGWTPWQSQAIFVFGFLGAPILGGLIASRRPENPYGWLWLGLGLAFALLSLAEPYAAYTLVVDPGSLPAPRTIVQVLGMGWVLLIILFPFLLLLFPDGRLPSRRWRFLAWPVVTVGAFLLILGPFYPNSDVGSPENPFAASGAVGEAIISLTDAGVCIIFAAIILSALSLVFRFRRATGIERQQIKWFAYAAVVGSGDNIFGGFLSLDLPGVWNALFETATIAGLYLAIGIAVLKYHLYDIDIIINRTLVYGALTATLIVVYLGGVLLLQGVFRVLTGQEQQPQLIIVASTLVIAGLFNPLRHRIQSFIDRRFYRRKYDARRTMEAFSAKLRDETDLDSLSSELLSTVRETVQPAHVSLWLSSGAATKSRRTD